MIFLADVLVDLPAMSLQEIGLIIGGAVTFLTLICSIIIPKIYAILVRALEVVFVTKKQHYATEKSIRDDLAKQKGLQDQTDSKTAQLLHEMKTLNTNIGGLSENLKENTLTTRQLTTEVAVLKDRQERSAT